MNKNNSILFRKKETYINERGVDAFKFINSIIFSNVFTKQRSSETGYNKYKNAFILLISIEENKLLVIQLSNTFFD